MTDLNGFACLGRHCSPAAYTIYRQSVCVCVCVGSYIISACLSIYETEYSAHMLRLTNVSPDLPCRQGKRGGRRPFVLAWSPCTAVSRDRYLSRGFIVAPAMSYGHAQGLAVAGDASSSKPAAVSCIHLHTDKAGDGAVDGLRLAACPACLAQPCFVATAAGHLQ